MADGANSVVSAITSDLPVVFDSSHFHHHHHYHQYNSEILNWQLLGAKAQERCMIHAWTGRLKPLFKSVIVVRSLDFLDLHGDW